MRSTLAVVLILALAACSDDGPSVLDLEDVRIAKVSGDQAAIAGTRDATPLRAGHVGPRLAVTAGEDWTPEPLVGRIEAVGARTNGISGPSMLPPDMLAHWHLDPEAGTLLAASTPPDDSLHIVNRWAPGTKAGTYRAVARRILADGTVHEDEEWTLVVEPGAVQWIAFARRLDPAWCEGDTVDLRDLVTHGYDAYVNRVAAAAITALPDSVIEWRMRTQISPTFEIASGEGWTIDLPDDFAAIGVRLWRGTYGVRVEVGIHGVWHVESRIVAEVYPTEDCPHD